MESIFKVGILLSVIDMVSGPLRNIDGGIKGLIKNAGALGPMFDNFQNYGRKVATVAAVIMTMMAGTAQAYATLEAAQLTLTTNIMDSSGKIGPEFAQLNALAENLGTSLPGSTVDMLNMFTALREQGVQTKVILGGMGEAAAKFAVLVKVPYVQGATYVAKFAEAFGIADAETVQFMDTLQRLKGAAGIDVPDLAESIKYVGSSLKTMGIQGIQAGKDVSAALGLMAISSIEGSQAGTGLAMAMSRMAEISSRLDSGKVKKLVGPLLDAAGIKLNFFDGNGQFVGIRNMIGELEKLRAINPQEQLIVLSKLFGEEASRPLSVFINQGVSGFDAMTQKMAQQADMQQKIKVIMSGIGMKWDTLTGTVQNFVMHIGAAVSKSMALGAVLDLINNGVAAVDGFITKYPELAGVIAGIVAGAAIVAFVLGMIFTAVGMIGLMLPAVTVGFASLGKAAVFLLHPLASIGKAFLFLRAGLLQMIPAVWSFTLALLANPITWVVVGVIALVAGLIWLYKHFEGVRNAVKIVLYVLGYFLGAVVRIGKEIWTSLQPALAALSPLLDLLGKAARIAGEGIKWAFLNLTPVGWLIQGFLKAEQFLAGLDWRQAGAKIVETLTTGIKSMAMSPVDAVVGVFNKVRALLPFSDAKEGPFSQLTLSGARIMETLGAGVAGAAPGLHKTMATALAGAALATSVAVTPVTAQVISPVVQDLTAAAAWQEQSITAPVLPDLTASATWQPQAIEPPAALPGRDGQVDSPARKPAADLAAKASGKTIIIQRLEVTLPGVTDGDGFIRELQAIVEDHDVS